MRNARMDAMMLALHLTSLSMPREPTGVPAWRTSTKEKRSRPEAKKRKAKRKMSDKSRKRNR